MRKALYIIGALLITAASIAVFLPADSGGQRDNPAKAREVLDRIQLPPPQVNSGRPRLEVLRDRQSRRAFSPRDIPPQVLSNLLWAAFGVNRPGSTMCTAPNIQAIELYLAMADGLYVYAPVEHELQLISIEDLREATAIPFHWDAYVSSAPLNIVYVSSAASAENFSFAVSGHITQNVYLYCASEGMSAVVRGSFPEDLGNALGLAENQTITLCQTVGYNRNDTFLYFPYVESNEQHETELVVVNTSTEQPLSGILRAYDEQGMEVLEGPGMVGTGTPIELGPRGRKEIILGTSKEYDSCAHLIRYVLFRADTDTFCGYAKIYRNGVSREALPAVRLINNQDIILPAVIANQQWWTTIAAVNTTTAPKTSWVEMELFDFSTRQAPLSLSANAHRHVSASTLFPGVRPEELKSGIITPGTDIVAAQLFGTEEALCGLPLQDSIALRLYYPHIVSNAAWSTEIAFYNPGDGPCDVTITAYGATGSPLETVNETLPGNHPLSEGRG